MPGAPAFGTYSNQVRKYSNRSLTVLPSFPRESKKRAEGCQWFYFFTRIFRTRHARIALLVTCQSSLVVLFFLVENFFLLIYILALLLRCIILCDYGKVGSLFFASISQS